MKRLEERILGMPEEDAIRMIETAGYNCRIIQRDNEKYIYPTTDVDSERFNLYIIEGKVSGFYKG